MGSTSAKAELEGERPRTLPKDLTAPSKLVTMGVKVADQEPMVTYIRLPKSTLFLPQADIGARPYTYNTLEDGCVGLLKRVPQSDPNQLLFEFVAVPLSSAKGQYSAIS